ncbi:hypothetical protein [Martelella limonii]|uniref:hypothetical protein n=1 Tax=Martelella limonii TaxID=1647649 RepID=UPI0015805DE9|nr:hypothetical protein [Martelella limonii]
MTRIASFSALLLFLAAAPAALALQPSTVMATGLKASLSLYSQLGNGAGFNAATDSSAAGENRDGADAGDRTD